MTLGHKNREQNHHLWTKKNKTTLMKLSELNVDESPSPLIDRFRGCHQHERAQLSFPRHIHHHHWVQRERCGREPARANGETPSGWPGRESNLCRNTQISCRHGYRNMHFFFRHDPDDSLTISMRRWSPGFGETRENRRHGAALEGSYEDQPLALHPGECHLRSGGRQKHPCALQELQTHPPTAGLAWRQLQDHDGGIN